MGMIAVPRTIWTNAAQNNATLSLSNTNAATLDAVGESVFLIGYARLSSGPGTSKLVSSAGARAFWRPGTTTFNNTATRVRLGIQPIDVVSTWIETGTFDCYAELTSASGIAANTISGHNIGTGSKTIADGDLIAIGAEMTARGGADSVIVGGTLTSSNAVMGFPYRSVDSGSGSAKSAGAWPSVALTTDDGTRLWIEGAPWNGIPSGSGTTINFSSASSPNEYGVCFQVPVPVRIGAGLITLLGSLTGTDEGLLSFYTDPFGTPTVPSPGTYTFTVNAGQFWSGSSGQGNVWMPLTNYDLAANTPYALAWKAVTGTVQWAYIDLGSGNSALKDVGVPFVAGSVSAISRTGSGAFSVVDATHLPLFGIGVDGLHDGTGGGTNIFRQHASGHLRR